ncbi:ATP synthase mitochondrial F1 complex assembly factor 1-like [Strongylocentrotus purpuratus]|uniref:ATP synthase mitochondrial F1 complex assembly factor 1 n=1 Tax=Strongylocentrotus purpuratus TaxID=7668 RepID=A0A7M7PKP0_STRPU|nr:ATP synthase mitochondrial F1 complex assembly factor 1-like [Strongylocentrotus purpuratus]
MIIKMAASMRVMFQHNINKFLLTPASWRPVARTLNVSYAHSSKADEDSSIDKNPFYEKYADKLKKLQSSNPEEYQRRLHLMRESVKKKEDVTQEQTPTLSDQPRPKLMSGTSGEEKGLDSVVKVDLLRKHSAEEITEIWKGFHREKDFICAVIPKETYAKIQQKAKEFPMFLYPLPRDEGYEFFFAQFFIDSCYFTSVINYQAYQENAPALLTLTHYTELQEEKGIVLMRGELDTKYLTVQQAQFFANEVQLYYASDDADRLRLLRDFNKRPADFKHADLIDQLSNTTVNLS